MLTIEEIDPHDETALRSFWEVEAEAMMADRPFGVTRSWRAFKDPAQTESPYYRHIYLVARMDGKSVGVCDIGLAMQDNLQLAVLGIEVLPEFQRQGIGTQLYAEAETRCRAQGRTSLIGGGYENELGRSGVDFAHAVGFETANREDHFRCPLPMSAENVGRLEALAEGSSDEYEIVAWAKTCPPEYAAAYCEMHTQMANDVPIGEVDYVPVVYDETRLRSQEERMALAYVQLVAAARRRSDGVFGGYTIVLVDPTTDHALQDDTLVMPDHRGHRLGLRLKLANLRILQSDYPGRTAIHTWSALDNAAMQRTNRTFGYVPVEIEHVLQKRLTPAAG